jgi:hypothetical protein
MSFMGAFSDAARMGSHTARLNVVWAVNVKRAPLAPSVPRAHTVAAVEFGILA